MRFDYTISAEDHFGFERAFAEETLTRAAPHRWWDKTTYAMWFSMLGLTAFFVGDFLQGLLLWLLVIGIFLACMSLHARITRRTYCRYLSALPGYGKWKTWVDDEFIVTEHMGYRISLPLAKLNDVTDDGRYVYLRFSIPVIVRIPVSALGDAPTRQEFVSWARNQISVAR